MSRWLTPEQVASILCVSRKTAVAMMYGMPHTVISGKERKRIRVSEETLEAWMLKRSTGTPVISSKNVGTTRKLQRR